MTEMLSFAFDLLDRAERQTLPLEERKARLADLLTPVAGGIVLSEHIEADGETVFRHACKLG